MDWLFAAYGAIALVCWGFFIEVDSGLNDGRRTPITNFVMAAVWPAALLMLAGYLIGRSRRGS